MSTAVNGTAVAAPLAAVINCEAEDLAWRDLAYSVEAQLDNWAWIVMLLLLFVLVRVLCICYLLQHEDHRGYLLRPTNVPFRFLNLSLSRGPFMTHLLSGE